jgi:glycosyltransferase involved in cell wall biosynthesis
VRVGIVATEFLQPGHTRIGGFGWAASRAADVLRAAGDEPVFVCPVAGPLPADFGGIPLVARRADRLRFVRDLRRARLDVLLSIDYRPWYRAALDSLPRTPLVVWVRDARQPEDVANVAAVRVPGRPDEVPQGLRGIDCTGLAAVVRRSRLLRRPIAFGSPAPDALTPKLPATYGIDPRPLALLPNPIDAAREPGPKAARPRVLFLARLDPVKRPWLFVELARSFPDVDFVLAGKSHFTGPGAWEPDALPPNVEARGNVTGDDKLRELDAAWALVNTSPHESLAVSFLEALASRTPLLACVDTESVVSRFGISVGPFPGDGLDALPALRAGLERLLGDDALRERLGTDGREWVRGRHTPERFLAAFRELVGSAR